MVTLKALVDYTDCLLSAGQFNDYCPNGLQVEGRPEVQRLVSGVTASLELVEAAIAADADAVLVHHGYFWKGEDACITGMKRRRLQRLLGTGTSLLAYHLPLDDHPTLGNNARLGELLGLQDHRPLQSGGEGVGNIAELPAALPVSELLASLRRITGREPLHIAADVAGVRHIAWCTGAAQGYIEAAIAAGADVFITGEASEQTVHIAREEGIHFIAAGHHATERYGVQAVAEQLAQEFSLQHRFIDIDNPV